MVDTVVPLEWEMDPSRALRTDYNCLDNLISHNYTEYRLLFIVMLRVDINPFRKMNFPMYRLKTV